MKKMAVSILYFKLLAPLLIVLVLPKSSRSLITAIPNTLINGVQTVCPGDFISLTCIHQNTAGEQTRWIFGDCICVVIHSPPNNCIYDCYNFALPLTMISDNSGSSVSSSAQATVTESLDGLVVQCLAGGQRTSPLAGSVTISVISIATPTIDSLELAVESTFNGSATINVSSQGAAVHFESSDAGGTGAVQVAGNVITLTGLDYTNTHIANITAASAVCPGIETKFTIVPISFNTSVPSLTQPVAFVTCSDLSLPVRVSWSVEPGVLTSVNGSLPLTPPLTATSTISYSSTGGRSDSTSSDSPYLLTDTVRNDVYTFTVSVTNVAGVSSAMSSGVLISPFEIDQSTIRSSDHCLTVIVNRDCLEEIANRDFSIRLQYAFGSCRNLHSSDFITSIIPLTTHSSCVPVSGGNEEFCYQATLIYRGTVIDSQTNIDFVGCLVSELESLLGAGVSYQLDGVESGGNVSHLTTAALSCDSVTHNLSGAPQTTCIDGTWSSIEMRNCSSKGISMDVLEYSVAAWLIAIAALVTLVLLAALVAIAVACCCCKYKQRKPAPSDINQLGPVYEEIKPDPHTEENLAYGHVQGTKRPHSSQSPTGMVEQICEDPHTQGNMAYGLTKRPHSSQPPTGMVEQICEDPHTQGNMAYGRTKRPHSSQPPTGMVEQICEDPHTQGNMAYAHVQL